MQNRVVMRRILARQVTKAAIRPHMCQMTIFNASMRE